jgi:hypothetical protein
MSRQFELPQKKDKFELFKAQQTPQTLTELSLIELLKTMSNSDTKVAFRLGEKLYNLTTMRESDMKVESKLRTYPTYTRRNFPQDIVIKVDSQNSPSIGTMKILPPNLPYSLSDVMMLFSNRDGLRAFDEINTYILISFFDGMNQKNSYDSETVRKIDELIQELLEQTIEGEAIIPFCIVNSFANQGYIQSQIYGEGEVVSNKIAREAFQNGKISIPYQKPQPVPKALLLYAINYRNGLYLKMLYNRIIKMYEYKLPYPVEITKYSKLNINFKTQMLPQAIFIGLNPILDTNTCNDNSWDIKSYAGSGTYGNAYGICCGTDL